MTNSIEIVTNETVSNGCSKAVKPIYGLAYLNELGIQGMGCEGACAHAHVRCATAQRTCACEMTSETSVQSACVRAFFPHMCDHTLSLLSNEN